MRARFQAVRARRRVAVGAAMVMVIILLMTQMWLLTATLDSFLAGHYEAPLPAMIVSGVLFLGCLGFYVMMLRLDRAPAEPEEEARARGPWEIG
jgi:hypothetical protein